MLQIKINLVVLLCHMLDTREAAGLCESSNEQTDYLQKLVPKIKHHQEAKYRV